MDMSTPKQKNEALAALLGFFFGALGLLYVGIGHAAAALAILLALGFVTGGYGWCFGGIICGVWGYIAASNINDQAGVGIIDDPQWSAGAEGQLEEGGQEGLYDKIEHQHPGERSREQTGVESGGDHPAGGDPQGTVGGDWQQADSGGPQPTNCHSCGAGLARDVGFCPECGREITSTTSW